MFSMYSLRQGIKPIILYHIKYFFATFAYILLYFKDFHLYFERIFIMNDKKGLDFKLIDVINISDGKRLGFVQDVTADFKTGTINEIIVPGNTKIFNLFSSKEELVIPWKSIKTIGEDVILVEI